MRYINPRFTYLLTYLLIMQTFCQRQGNLWGMVGITFAFKRCLLTLTLIQRWHKNVNVTYITLQKKHKINVRLTLMNVFVITLNQR